MSILLNDFIRNVLWAVGGILAIIAGFILGITIALDSGILTKH